MSIAASDLIADDEQSGTSTSVKSGESVRLFLTAIEYTDERGKPVTHLFGRDADRQKHHVRVEGHRPHFFVKEDDYRPNIENHHAVYDTERVSDTTLDDEKLVKVYTYLPKQVSDLQEMFDETYEADVFYDNRFLIDEDIYTGFRVHVSEGESEDGESSVEVAVSDENHYPSNGETRVSFHTVTTDDIETCDPPSVRQSQSDSDTVGESSDSAEVDSRVLTTDIEVASEGGFPNAGEANWPVSTIVAHDSYADEYVGWILRADEWDDSQHTAVDEEAAFLEDTGLDELRRFDDEADLLHDFHEYVAAKSFDVFTGWNSSDYDYRYLVNRSKQKSVYSYQDWSELGDVWIANRRKEPVIKGATTFDMMAGYEKTQIHELDSKKLEDVAQDELGYGKRDVERSHTEMWKENPVEFLHYNKIDVELVVKIEEKQDVFDTFRHIRSIAGCQLDAPLGGNIDLMDVYFLREANKRGYRLPTAEKPDSDWVYGAKVFDMAGGVDKNVVYFDLASLYPNMIRMLNISPETLVGTCDDPSDSMIHGYIDTRSDSVKKESNPEYTPCYYESNTSGFVSDLVDDVIAMKNKYRGTEKYEAIKRVTNSIFGIVLDSDSYNTGFRLFDWRMGESITLSGRKVIDFCADTALDYAQEHNYGGREVVMGDTDGFGIPLDECDDPVDAAHEIADHINSELPQFCADEFGIEPEDNTMEIEVESHFKRVFTGEAKKRYSTLEQWNDDDGQLNTPELSVKGYEYVRSDVAQVTKDAQAYVFNAIMRHPKGKAHELVSNYVNWLHSRIESGAYLSERLGRPFGIGQDLDEYGSPSRRPQPSYRGARYANEVIYEGEAIGEGDKPLLFYVNGVGGDLPSTYPDWNVAGGGDRVDAISVNEAEDLPAEAHIDTETMIQKTVKDPLGRIFDVLGWSYDEMLLDSNQTDLANYM